MSRSSFTCKYVVEIDQRTPKSILENPLLRSSDLPLDAIPLDIIKEGHFEEALSVTYKLAEQRVTAILNSTDEPTFQNTIEAIEFAFDPARLPLHMLAYFRSSNATPGINLIAKTWNGKFTTLSDRLSLSSALFARVERLHRNAAVLQLRPDQQRLLQVTFDSMKKEGAGLSSSARKKIAAISKELVTLRQLFQENFDASSRNRSVHVKDASRLNGVPDTYVARALEARQKAGLDTGYLITLDPTTYLTFMGYAEDRSLRKEIYIARSQIATEGQHNNLPVVLKIAKLRQTAAKIRGHESYAHDSLQNTLAKDPKVVRSFLESLAERYLSAAQKEFSEIEAYAGHKIQPYDQNFYSRKLKNERYSFDPMDLTPYFKVENVLEGAMQVAQKLYQIQGALLSNLKDSHYPLSVFRFDDQKAGEFVSLFYLDAHMRPGKSPGAHCRTLLPAGVCGAEVKRPQVLNSLTEPPADPTTGLSLLAPSGVRTLFHEFGHALHAMLTQGTYSSLLGTNVSRDFVELPSQILERWAFQPEVLALYAKHHETGEPIPLHLIQAMQESSKFQVATAGLAQVRYALLDLTWHDGTRALPKDPSEIASWESELLGPWQLVSTYGSSLSQSFSHIFAGGYAAGYYSYKWSEVLAASAFAPFLKHGLFNQEWADRFRRTILERGNQEDPAKLYRDYLGHDADPTDLLREEGI
jgi:Zn-dependent oligopeptidase